MSQNTDAPVADAAEPKKKEEFTATFEMSDTGYTFFVSIQGTAPETRASLKKLGGAWNSRMSCYTFQTSMYSQVCDLLGMQSNGSIADPRKVITVNFTRSFQWEGDKSTANTALKNIGMRQERDGTWTGDLDKVALFHQAFSN